MVPTPPEAFEYAPSFADYVGLMPDGDILAHLEVQPAELVRLLGHLSEAQALHRYAPGKWSLKEVVGHLIDGERVFADRVLRFSRRDPTPLPGFDEDAFVAQARFDARVLGELLWEFHLLRAANLLMFKDLEEEAWARTGVANGHPATVRAMIWVMGGHVVHHLDVLRERYLGLRG